MKTFCMIILLLLCSCSKNLSYDNSDIFNSAINLQENSEIILTEIQKAILSDDSEFLYIHDYKSNTIIKYDATNGEIIDYTIPYLELSDSIIANSPEYFYRDSLKYRYVSIGEIRKSDSNLSIAKHLKHYFGNINLIDSELFAIMTIYSPAMELYKQNKLITNQAAIAKFDKDLNIVSLTPLQAVPKAHSLAYEFTKYNNRYYASCGDFIRANQYEKYDSLPIIASYSLNGEFRKIEKYLPDSYVRSKMGYFTSLQIHLLPVNNNLFYNIPSYPYLLYMNESSKFPIRSYAHANDKGFSEFDYTIHQDIDKYLLDFPVSVRSIYSGNSNIYTHLLYALQDSSGAVIRTGILQKYDLEGNFIDSVELGDYKKNKIKFIGYAKQKDCFFVIKFDNKTGWSLEYVNYFGSDK